VTSQATCVQQFAMGGWDLNSNSQHCLCAYLLWAFYVSRVLHALAFANEIFTFVQLWTSTNHENQSTRLTS
jgi:hypothetical protein